MKNEDFSAMLKKIDQLPLDQVIQRTLEESGGTYKNGITDPTERGFLCPFHDDHSGGHAGIYTSKHGVQKFHCFVCGETLDTIGFVRKYKAIGFRQAAFEIAASFGIISPEEFKEECGKGFTAPVKQVVVNHTKVNLQPLAPLHVLDTVYRIMQQGCKLSGSDCVLSKADLNYLHSRNITDKEIRLYGYFTMPTPKLLPVIINKVKAAGLTVESLYGVPGFYRNKKTNEVCLAEFDGIGIPIFNHDRQIQALQVRARGNVLGPRYKFLSSSFTSKKAYVDTYDRGVGPSTPVNVLYPYNIKDITKCICITEGTFKAAQFASHFNATAISVQGVNNTRSVVPEIKAIEQKLNLSTHPDIYVAYDMDMYENEHVLKALDKLIEMLQEAGYQVWVLTWNPEWKGLDDFLIARDKGIVNEAIRGVKAEKFMAEHQSQNTPQLHLR